MGASSSFSLEGVVPDADQARRGDLVEAVRIVVPVDLDQLVRIFRDVFVQKVLVLEIGEVAEIGGAQDIHLHRTRFDLLRHPLKRDLGRRAHRIDLDARIGRFEIAAEGLSRRVVRVRRVPGQFAFLLGRFVELFLAAAPLARGERDTGEKSRACTKKCGRSSALHDAATRRPFMACHVPPELAF